MLMNNCMSFQRGWVEGEDTQGVVELVVFVKISRFAHLSVLPHVSFHNILSPKDKYGRGRLHIFLGFETASP